MSDFLNPKPNRFVGGQEGPSATELNRILDLSPRLLEGGGDASVDRYGDRWIVRSQKALPSLPDVTNYKRQFVVREELDDCLLCVPFFQPTDPTTSFWVPYGYDKDFANDSQVYVYVAKPFVLQKSPWNTKTVVVDGTNLHVSYSGVTIGQRTISDDSGNTQDQRIAMPYLTGDVIWAVKSVSGLTGPDGNAVIWHDTNNGARQWVTTTVTGTPSPPGALLGGPVISTVTGTGGGGTTAKYESYWRDPYQSHPIGDHFYLAGGGGHNATAVTDAISPVYVFALPFVTPRAGTIKHIGMYLAVGSFGDQCRVGLYDTTVLLGQTGPGNLLCQAQIFTGVAGNAPIDVDATSGPIIVAANSLYWLAFSGSATLTVAVRQPQDLWPIFGVREQGAFSGEFHNVVGWKYARAAYAILPNVFASDATGGTVLKLATDEAIPLLLFTYKTLP